MAVSYQLVIDCASPETLARFWAEALHYVSHRRLPGSAVGRLLPVDRRPGRGARHR